MCGTYGLSPSPVSRHHISALLLLTIELLIGHIVNMAIEVWMCEDILDDLVRVPIPDVVLRSHPLWIMSCFWKRVFIFEASVFPLNTTKVNRVDLSM